jgi:hypothetical protein
VSGQFRAPLLSARLAGVLLAALLLVPVVLRLSASGKDTKATKEATAIERLG